MEQQPSIELPKIVEVKNQEIVTEGVTPLTRIDDGYFVYKGSLYKQDALKEINPSLFGTTSNQVKTKFGNQFPKVATKGDIFVRVDVLPNRVFKFDGIKWIEVDKNNTQSYLADDEYLEFLIGKINSGEYDLDSLLDTEKDAISEYLRNQNN